MFHNTVYTVWIWNVNINCKQHCLSYNLNENKDKRCEAVKFPPSTLKITYVMEFKIKC